MPLFTNHPVMDIEFIDFFTELSFLVLHFHVSIAEAKERSDPS